MAPVYAARTIRYARAAVTRFALHLSSLLRPLALLIAVMAAIAPTAAAQAVDLSQPPVTKEDLKKAKEAADDSASDSGDGDVVLGLVIVGGIMLAGAAGWILIDARDRTGGRGDRVRPLTTGDVGKGAPKTMFTGAAAPGGKVGKRGKRVQGKRQRNARKANRPK